MWSARTVLRISGNLMIAASILGLIALGVALLVPEDSSSALVTPLGVLSVPAWMPGAVPVATLDNRRISLAAGSIGTAPLVAPAGFRPITYVAIPSIDLAAEVLQADLVPVEGGLTWQVPAFKVGHAETTAGAGQPGNAVLLGHVTSVRSGNVFQSLDRVSIGDLIQVYSDADEFDYQVVSTTQVPGSDSSVLQATPRPSVSLITCTGVWLPTIWDYTERLVVHAELLQ